MNRQLLRSALVALCGSVQAAPQPNIIVYMVDDLGWNHISAKLGTMETADELYQTPNIEKLAKSGLSFTHAYAQPNCAPTRAAMLSGRYPARVINAWLGQSHPTWKPKYPIRKSTGQPAGPPPTL